MRVKFFSKRLPGQKQVAFDLTGRHAGDLNDFLRGEVFQIAERENQLLLGREFVRQSGDERPEFSLQHLFSPHHRPKALPSWFQPVKYG